MAGSLFAGVEESPGETIIYNGRKFKAYRGMGSIEAMQQGSKDRYFQDIEDDIKKTCPEGIAGTCPLQGTLSEGNIPDDRRPEGRHGLSGSPGYKHRQEREQIRKNYPFRHV